MKAQWSVKSTDPSGHETEWNAVNQSEARRWFAQMAHTGCRLDDESSVVFVELLRNGYCETCHKPDAKIGARA